MKPKFSCVYTPLLAVCASLALFLQAPTTAAESHDLKTPASRRLPNKVLWAWKRPEDLSQIDPETFGVAYLACHVFLEGENVKWQSRNQPLKVPAHTVVVPTVRIDVVRKEKPALSQQQIEKVVRLIKKAAGAPNAAQVQIDFDALESERGFYRSLLEQLRKALPATMPISITALASWCLFDNWIKDLPIDESVPMMFSLGRERDKVLRYFRSQHDFIEERAKRSLGLSLEDTAVNELMIPITRKRKIPVRVYVFTRTAWTAKKLQAVNSMLSKL
jgi:hypothetical protein